MSILRKLKKILRRYRGILALGGLLLGLLLSFAWVNSYSIIQTEPETEGTGTEEVIDVLGKQLVELTVETHYLCGTETEVKQFEHAQALAAWLETQYLTASDLIEEADGSLKLITEVNDLSPMCKNEGYFGISADGMLSIFQGPPAQNRVIESFFRLDTELLDVRLPKSEINLLQQGIRVQNVSEYMSILSTYGEFAAEY